MGSVSGGEMNRAPMELAGNQHQLRTAWSKKISLIVRNLSAEVVFSTPEKKRFLLV